STATAASPPSIRRPLRSPACATRSPVRPASASAPTPLPGDFVLARRRRVKAAARLHHARAAHAGELERLLEPAAHARTAGQLTRRLVDPDGRGELERPVVLAQLFVLERPHV